MDPRFLDLTDRVFVITGAGSGIGRETARLCNDLGAKLILLDKNEAGLEQTRDGMESGKCLCITLDLTSYDTIEEAVRKGVEHFGPLSGFCHCAGFEYTLPIRSMTPRHYQELFAVNTIAGFEMARVCSKKKFCSEAGASFVFIASIMGVVGRPGLTGYSASKGALIAGMRSLALELANKKIRVNTVSPGTVMTDLIRKMLDNLEPEQRDKRLGDFPLGIGEPADVANCVAFLFSPRSRWITGSNIIIDGGYTAR